MASRTLDQVISSLNTTYNPQIQSIQKRQSAIPGQIAQEEQGLQAKQTQAFGDILGGARRRGLGFSGIPLGEQATYTSTEFLPALARLRQTGREQAMSLEDAILGLRSQQRQQAQSIFDADRNYALQQAQFRESQRQFNENLKLQRQQAAQAGGAGYAPTNNGGGEGGKSALPVMSRRKDGGYNFTYNGRAISAAQYSQLKKIPFRDLLANMAKDGDKGAAAALGYVGNDYGVNKKKVDQAYRSWGGKVKVGNSYMGINDVINSLRWGL